MTTPTWEPVGQEVLETSPFAVDTQEIAAMQGELLAARALLVEEVEAEAVLRRAEHAADHAQRMCDEARFGHDALRLARNDAWDVLSSARHRLGDAQAAIRAHVQRLQESS